MQVIALCGYAGSGKDTAAEALIQEGWQRVSFADPIREMALAIDPLLICGARLSKQVAKYGWDTVKGWPEPRKLLQRIGTEAGRKILGQYVWIDLAFEKVKAAREAKCPGVVFTDLRFPNEYNVLFDHHATIIRISRPGIGPVNDHQSDQHLASFEVDHEIVNDGDKEKLWAAIRAVAKGEE